MSDPATDLNTVPSFAAQIMATLMRHGIGAIGGYFVVHGLASQASADAFTEGASGAVMVLAMVAWSWIQKRTARKVLVAAANAPKAWPPVQ